jgi:hypothetical protein
LLAQLKGVRTGVKRWVIKEPTVNNALGVHFVEEEELLTAVLRLATRMSEDEEGEGPTSLLIQPYMPGALVDGAFKFHIRVNALVLGVCAVFLHRAAVCHVACEPLHCADGTLAPPPSVYAHVTNHGTQARHPSYAAADKTLTLEAACARLSPPAAPADVRAAISAVVAALFTLLMDGRTVAAGWETLPSPAHRIVTAKLSGVHNRTVPRFLPHPSAYEPLGLDFMLTQDGLTPVLLEVNSGPALESRANPGLARSIVEDTLDLVLAARGGGGVPVPGEASGFERVY